MTDYACSITTANAPHVALFKNSYAHAFAYLDDTGKIVELFTFNWSDWPAIKKELDVAATSLSIYPDTSKKYTLETRPVDQQQSDATAYNTRAILHTRDVDDIGYGALLINHCIRGLAGSGSKHGLRVSNAIGSDYGRSPDSVRYSAAETERRFVLKLSAAANKKELIDILKGERGDGALSSLFHRAAWHDQTAFQQFASLTQTESQIRGKFGVYRSAMDRAPVFCGGVGLDQPALTLYEPTGYTDYDVTGSVCTPVKLDTAV